MSAQSSPRIAHTPRIVTLLSNLAFGLCATVLGLAFGSGLGLLFIFWQYS